MTKREDVPTQFNCTNCPNKIPLQRLLRDSFTCSGACAAAVKREKRKLQDLNRCKLCRRPWTAEQARSWHRWAKEKGIILERGRPRNKVSVEQFRELKPLAESAAAVQDTGKAKKRSRSQSLKEV